MDFRCEIEKEFKYNLNLSKERRVQLLRELEVKYPEDYRFKEKSGKLITGVEMRYFELKPLGRIPLHTQIQYITDFTLGFHSGECKEFYSNNDFKSWILSDKKILVLFKER